MSFVGPVNRLGDAFVRPHDIELRIEPERHDRRGQVERIVHLGFEVRVELVLEDGERRLGAGDARRGRGGSSWRRAGRSSSARDARKFSASAERGREARSRAPSGPTAGSQSRRHVVAASALDSRRMSQLSKTWSWSIRTRAARIDEVAAWIENAPSGAVGPSARTFTDPSCVFSVTSLWAGMRKTAAGARPWIATPRLRRPSHHCAGVASTRRAGVSE